MLPLDITLRDIPHSPAIDSKIRKNAEKLNHLNQGHTLEFCKVVVALAQNNQNQGKLYSAHIEVKVPGKLLVVSHKEDEDLYVVLRDAFAAMKKKIDSYRTRQRGHVKLHTDVLYGKLSRLFGDYGFLEALDGREYYFDATRVLNDYFEQLEEGMLVSFIEGPVGETLQATHINMLKNETIQ